jgi:hypothetical protein
MLSFVELKFPAIQQLNPAIGENFINAVRIAIK